MKTLNVLNTTIIPGNRYLFLNEDVAAPKDILELYIVEIHEELVKIKYLGGSVSWINMAKFCSQHKFTSIVQLDNSDKNQRKPINYDTITG